MSMIWQLEHICAGVHDPGLVVKQRLCVTSEIETTLPGSRVSYNSVVDHRSQWPVSSLCSVMSTGVMSDHIGRREWSQGGGYLNISTHGPVWMCFSNLKHHIKNQKLRRSQEDQEKLHRHQTSRFEPLTCSLFWYRTTSVHKLCLSCLSVSLSRSSFIDSKVRLM